MRKLTKDDGKEQGKRHLLYHLVRQVREHPVEAIISLPAPGNGLHVQQAQQARQARLSPYTPTLLCLQQVLCSLSVLGSV